MQVTDREHAIAHPAEGLAEAGPLGAVAAVAERQRRLAFPGNRKQIRGADLRGAEAIPPGRDEVAPQDPFGIGEFVELLRVGEESGYAGDIENAAHDLGPRLEAAEGRALIAGPSGLNPGAAEREAGGDERTPIGLDPG